MEMLTKGMVGDEDITKAEEPKYDYSDENLVNLPSRVLEGYLAKKYGTDRYVRERSSVFEEASKNKISDRESILTGPELEALSLVFEKQIKQMKAKAKGGVAEQMEMFQEGGLKDEGGTVDPVSGNEVPIGSTQEEVRDDIPAQLSEGEFVFPADVVRYLGLEFLMKLRQRAKAGLQKMEEMGQMGNSDEATLPDDIPFTVDDLDMREETEEEMEMYQGGAVKAQAGMYVAPSIAPVRAGTTTATQPFMTQPTVAQTPMAFQQPPVAQVNPNLTFANFLGPSAGGAPETEIRRYEHPDGRVRNITVVKATGLPLIPGELDKAKADGFDFKPEALKEEVKVEPIKQQTSRVQSTLSDGDGGPEPTITARDPAGDALSYKSVFNMDALDKNLASIGSMQLRSLGLNPYDMGRNVVTSARGKGNINNISLGAITGYYTKTKTDMGKKGINVNTLSATERNELSKAIDVARATVNEVSLDDEGNSLSQEDIISNINTLASVYGIEATSVKDIQKELGRNFNLDVQLGKKLSEVIEARQKSIKEREDKGTDTGTKPEKDMGLEGLGIGQMRGIQEALETGKGSLDTSGITFSGKTGDLGSTTSPTAGKGGMDASFGGGGSDDVSAGPDAAASGGFGGSSPGQDYGGTYKGSLITRKKSSKKNSKRMKKGGLASKK